ncbi:MAG: hypothetical protein Q8M26_02785 [Pseudolabrys sp.]|nr:hypothetical protein [Pseudolabrys sp.]
MPGPVPMNPAAKPKPKRKALRPPRKLRPKRDRALPLRALASHAPIRWTLCPYRLCRRKRCCVLAERCLNPRAPWRDRRPVFVQRTLAKLKRWLDEDIQIAKQRAEERNRALWRARIEAFERPNTWPRYWK